jgi:hypothetical protein
MQSSLGFFSGQSKIESEIRTSCFISDRESPALALKARLARTALAVATGMDSGKIEWILCFASGFSALVWISGDLQLWASSLGFAAQKKTLRAVSLALQEIEETLASGLVPAQEKWKTLGDLPTPWGSLAHQSLMELRSSGGALLPTLRRLRNLADDQQVTLMDAKAKSAQALSQALVCSLLVPLFGSVLYLLLPGVSDHPYRWGLCCLGALILASVGSGWLLRISSNARWGGLVVVQRPWLLAAQCAGERFLALIRAGTPSDLAWTRACELLNHEAPTLAVHWGANVWSSLSIRDPDKKEMSGSARALVEAGTAIKKGVQLSLMEGRPCTERVEAALLGLRQELRAQVDRELALLGTRTLKPLFVCVAPAILGLLGSGMWMAWQGVAAGLSI